MLVSCFTGVENTPKITEKDVSRTINELERRQPTMTLKQYRDSLITWKVGKEFYVTDNQVRLLFTHDEGFNLDSVQLGGKVLQFKGYTTSQGVDNRDIVSIILTDGDRDFTYQTGKVISEFTSSYAIPLLIDMDMVRNIASQLVGKDVYIKTPIWYDIKGEYMIRGRQFIKVHIDSVMPGNKVLPLRVQFTASDNNQQAFVWMSGSVGVINNRDYDSMFSTKDLHENYPEITTKHWELIINGSVEIDMTKEECRLANGAPRQIVRRPDQASVKEYWYYDGGAYLQFVDGLLKNFRK